MSWENFLKKNPFPCTLFLNKVVLIVKFKRQNMEFDKIKRVVLGEASEEERREVSEWAAWSGERAHFLADAENFYREDGMDDGKIAGHLRRVWVRLDRRTRKSRLLRMVRIASVAACLAAVVGLGFWLWPDSRETVAPVRQVALRPSGVQLVLPDGSRHGVDGRSLAKADVPGFQMSGKGGLRQLDVAEDTLAARPEVRFNEVIVPRGTTYSLVLADGTEVFLNAETRMRFPDRFEDGVREIFLDGEAFFKVRRDESRPFVVRAGGASVRVLGTEFNVRAYADDNTSATLVSGSVRFSAGRDSAVLRPGQQCELDAMDRSLSLREVDLMSVLAWKSGEFIFRDVSLEAVMREVARWYDVEVAYAADGLRSRKIYIYMDRPDTVDEVLEQFVRLGGIGYEIEDNRILLKEEKQ